MGGFTLLDVIQIAILIYSVVLHEVAHGLVARALGDRTAERLGRLTLNPLKHLDMFGSFILPILTKVLGGIMFGYAKPVPYDPAQLSDRKYGPAKVALAGPATNIALAVLFGLFLRFGVSSLSPMAASMMAYVVVINLVLALFNLMPVPPLDGHWLLMTFLPRSAVELKLALYRYQWVFLVLIITVVFPALSPVIDLLFRLITGLSL
jgi:Zn-dependent protease